MKRYEMRKAGHYPIAVPLANGKYILFTEAQAIVKTAREALESIAANTCCDKCQEAALVARAAIAALDAFGEGE